LEKRLEKRLERSGRRIGGEALGVGMEK